MFHDEGSIVWAKSFAHRELRSDPNYLDLATIDGSVPPYVADLPLYVGETLLGVYERHTGERAESIAVTNRGLYVARDQDWRYIPYGEIVSAAVLWPDAPTWRERKRQADSVVVVLTTGATVILPVGHHNVGGFASFVDRTAAALRPKGAERLVYRGRRRTG